MKILAGYKGAKKKKKACYISADACFLIAQLWSMSGRRVLNEQTVCN